MRSSIIATLVLFVLVPCAAEAITISFDALAPGVIVTTIDGVTFTVNVPSQDGVVSTGLPTFSPANYLGVSGGRDEVFLPGDVLTFVLPFPAQTLAFAVISTAGTPADAFELVTPVGSISSGGTPHLMFGDDEVYLISFTSITPFTSAELRTIDDDLFAFHVDQIEVPEPGAPMMLGAGAWSLLVCASHRRYRVRNREARRDESSRQAGTSA